MAKLPVLKRILKEDIVEAPGWMDRVLVVLNSFMESVYNALNKNLTFSDNIACQINEVTFTTSADYTTNGTFNVIALNKTIKFKASSLLVSQLFINSNNYVPITTTPFVNWIDNGTQILIPYIAGLEDSTTYTVRFLIF